MKKHHYRNKITRISFAALLIIASGIAFAENSVSDTVDGLYRRAVAAYDNKDYKTSLNQFREVQKEFPASKHAVRVWEYIAQCENMLGDKYAAFDAYQKIWDDHKDFNKL